MNRDKQRKSLREEDAVGEQRRVDGESTRDGQSGGERRRVDRPY